METSTLGNWPDRRRTEPPIVLKTPLRGSGRVSALLPSGCKIWRHGQDPTTPRYKRPQTERSTDGKQLRCKRRQLKGARGRHVYNPRKQRDRRIGLSWQ